MVTALSNRLTGEAFVVAPTNTSLPAALHRIGESLLRIHQAAEVVASNRVTQSLQNTVPADSPKKRIASPSRCGPGASPG